MCESVEPVKSIALIAAASFLALSGQVRAQPMTAETLCTLNSVTNGFKGLMRSWSLRQRVLVNRVGEDDERDGPQWIVHPRGATSQPRLAAKDGGVSADNDASTIHCIADFEYRGTNAMAGLSSTERFTIRDVVYGVADDQRPGGEFTISLQGLPASLATDASLIFMKDRMTIAGVPLSKLIERASEPAKPVASRPKNIVEAYEQLGNQANAELETEMRRQGLGGMVDAEKERRARMSPKERAAEDAWIAGPARGETMCRQENGITRCKTR